MTGWNHTRHHKPNPRLRIRKAGHPQKHRRDRIVPLRKTRGARRYKIPDPVRSPTYERDRKRREARNHNCRVQKALERIMEAVAWGERRKDRGATSRVIQIILEDVIP